MCGGCDIAYDETRCGCGLAADHWHLCPECGDYHCEDEPC